MVALALVADAHVERLHDAEVHVHGLVVDRVFARRPGKEGSEGRLTWEGGRLDAPRGGGDLERHVQPRAHRLAVALRARQLPRHVRGHAEVPRGSARQSEAIVEQARRVDERVAVHDPVAGELGVLQAGDHAEDAALLGKRQVRLESHEVVARAVRVLRAQLERSPGAPARMRIGQPDRLERPEARRVATGARNFLDGLACLEQVA